MPICGILMQAGFTMAHLFSLMSAVATLVMLAAIILPHQTTSDRVDIAANKSPVLPK